LSNTPKLGFGGFLIGLGVGWVIVTYYRVSRNLFSWLLILAGAGVIISALISRSRPRFNIGGLVGGLMGGLILSLFITSGLGFPNMFPSGPLGDYRAQDTKSFSGAIAEDRVYLEVDSFNGPISVSSWQRNEYSIDLLIKARGTTDKAAERNLEDFKYTFDESTVQGRKKLVLRHNVQPSDTSKYSLHVEVSLPAEATIDLDLTSSNGVIELGDITGESLKLHTSNGEVVLDDVYAEVISVETSNGRIRGRVEAPEMTLTTSNGQIDLSLPCTVTGRYTITTSNGAVDLAVSSNAEVGYDIDLSTSNGSIDIDLPDLSYTTNQRTRKEAHTTDFDSKDVQITINASTSNSDIDIKS
jgi:hypothetical protein